MSDPRPHEPECDVLALVHEEAWEDVAADLHGRHPVDIADIIQRAPHNSRRKLFSLLNEAAKPDVLAELQSAAIPDVLELVSDTELSHIVEEMTPDDAADVLSDLPEERSEQVLELMEDEESEEVRKLLEYDEDTAGGIMTPEVVAMAADQTVEEALQAIAYVETKEPFFHANIVDGDGRLVGHVDIWDLLRQRDRARPIGELLHDDTIAATVDMDQEEVAHLMNKYSLAVVPVIDADGRLVGRVTSDDVIDVIEEEASEDIFRLAGSDDAELETRSALHSCRVRLPWLFMTLLGGFVTSLILRHFLNHVSGLLVLAAFVPIVLAMGGNTGIQSSTLIVRRIALGGIKRKNIPRLLLREVATGAMMGVICGLLIGVWAHFIATPLTGGLASPLHLASVVTLALFSAMTFAAVFGALVPILLDRFKIDPAVASGPFITITNDISALLIYFAVTSLLLNIVP